MRNFAADEVNEVDRSINDDNCKHFKSENTGDLFG